MTGVSADIQAISLPKIDARCVIVAFQHSQPKLLLALQLTQKDAPQQLASITLKAQIALI
jgi:hypothetical protein